MSHPFGDLLSQYLHRKHGLSQSRLAVGILQDPSIIGKMCKGDRLHGPQARERVLAIIDWLWREGALLPHDEANALLAAAGMASLQPSVAREAALLANLSSRQQSPQPVPNGFHPDPPSITPRVPHHNLPTQLTPLIGRAAQIAELTERVSNTRLLTLIGPPGVGKTRLAIQVANQLLDHFADGVFFAPLAPVRALSLAPAVVCQVIGLQESGLTAVERLKLYLGEKHLLLILDNFEQLLMPPPVAIGEGIAWVSDLLAACPQLHILVTSRAPLRMRAEHQFAVPPLALPDLAQAIDHETIANSAAVTLFVERAQTVQPAFALTPQNAANVASLCVRLDGLPLAIELVAARVKLLPPTLLLARLNRRLLLSSDGLRDSTPRQQTLYDAIEWSYDLLTPSEQRLFARLSVFAGGFTLEAAEVVCKGNGELAIELLDGLASLLDKNLITQKADDAGNVRFGMLELIHEFALERLEMSGELSLLRGYHAKYYLRLAEEADRHLRRAEQLAWFAQLEAEHHNFRAGLAWCTNESGDLQLGLRLVNALSWFWFVRCYYDEGSRWIDRMLAVADERTPTSLRLLAFSHASLLAIGLDDFARGRNMGDQALALAREVGDQRLIAHVVASLSSHYACQGELQAAQQLITETLALLRTGLDEPWLTGRLLHRLICCYDAAADAARILAEALPLADQVGDRWLLGALFSLAGKAAINHGDDVRAANLYQQALHLAHLLQDSRLLINGLEAWGNLTLSQGNLEQAAEYYRAGFEVARRTGTPGFIAAFLRGQGDIAQKCGDDRGALRYYRQALTWVQPLKHHLFVTSCLPAMAVIVAAKGYLIEATRLVGAAEGLYPINSLSMDNLNGDPNTCQIMEVIHNQIEDPIFAAAWAEGQRMTVDEAIAYALSLGIPG